MTTTRDLLERALATIDAHKEQAMALPAWLHTLTDSVTANLRAALATPVEANTYNFESDPEELAQAVIHASQKIATPPAPKPSDVVVIWSEKYQGYWHVNHLAFVRDVGLASRFENTFELRPAPGGVDEQ